MAPRLHLLATEGLFGMEMIVSYTFAIGFVVSSRARARGASLRGSSHVTLATRRRLSATPGRNDAPLTSPLKRTPASASCVPRVAAHLPGAVGLAATAPRSADERRQKQLVT